MDRRSFLRTFALAATAGAAPLMLSACGRTHSRARTSDASKAASDSTRYTAPVDVASLRVHDVVPEIAPLDVEPDAWRPLLSDAAWAVLFEADTERPFTSPLLKENSAGTFVCAACYLPLFPSTTKYESGTGWPSFWAPLPNRIGTMRDTKLAIPRVEYHCARCGGHQGHVFTDGPDPTGFRYCNNGVALRFIPESEPIPGVRTPSGTS